MVDQPRTATGRANPEESRSGDPGPGSPPTRLNIFQRTMLGWNDLHPYNAVHVVRLPEALQFERLRSVIAHTLEGHRLTSLRLNRVGGTYRYEGGPALVELQAIPVGAGSQAALHAEIERQLNTAFVAEEQVNPFRFLVAPEPDGFWLGLVYFHAVADAESVVLLMRDLVEAYRTQGESVVFQPIDLDPPCYDNVLRHYPGVFARKLAGYPALLQSLRRSCRPRYRDVEDLRNGFRFFSLELKSLRAFVAAGKAWGVTLNDVLLALLMRGLSPLASGRRAGAKRTRISIGCIVNLRKDLALAGQRTFGLFLGSFLVSHEVPESIGLMDLARDVRRQTLAIKQSRLYLGAPVEMAVARIALAFFSTPRRKKFYQKHYPLWGGVTNMNLNSLWKPPADERPIDYFRAVSTGPVTPLVLSATTVGDRVNIGLTYRPTVFSAQEIERFVKDFLAALGQLEGQAWAQE